MSKWLIIPDCHVHPDYSNDRFDWLGQFILEEQPEYIFQLGDLHDLPSLSSYDKGTKGFEGRRYEKDIAAGRDANRRLWAPVRKYNEGRKLARKAQYRPNTVLLRGNHEDRITRCASTSPQFDGTIGLNNLGDEEYWDVIVPYQVVYTLEGFCFNHLFATGVSGRAIGGDRPAASLLKKGYCSAIAGHSHIFDTCTDTRWDGSKIVGIVAGCYVHQDMIEAWNTGTFYKWWNGVVILENPKDGYFSGMRTITQEALRALYA